MRGFLAATALIAGFCPAVALAVEATQIVEREIAVTGADGKTTVKRAPADKVAPGETVVYTLRYENEQAKAADGVVLVMPVPPQISYVEGSVSGAGGVSFSVDGGRTYMPRGRLSVVEKGAERPARSDEITHIKWSLIDALAPSAKGEVSFKGVLR